MTVEMINEFMDSVVRGTLTGICFAFWLLCMAGIWKWFIGVMNRPADLGGGQKKDEEERQWKRQ